MAVDASLFSFSLFHIHRCSTFVHAGGEEGEVEYGQYPNM